MERMARNEREKSRERVGVSAATEGAERGSERRSETRGTPGLESAPLRHRVAVTLAAPLATRWHLARGPSSGRSRPDIWCGFS